MIHVAGEDDHVMDDAQLDSQLTQPASTERIAPDVSHGHDEARQSQASATILASTSPETSDDTRAATTLPIGDITLPSTFDAHADYTAPTYVLSRPAPAQHPSGQHTGFVGLLARPFPFWMSAFLVVGVFTLLSLVYSATEVLAGADWADGAVVVGRLALIFAGVTLLVTLLRIAVGRRALSMIGLAALFCLLLTGTGIGGLNFSTALHRMQAGVLEGRGIYEAAIHEYTLAGESAPNAPDIARVYDEWGESLLKAHDYARSVAAFSVVATNYAESGDEVMRAYAGMFKGFTAWVTANAKDVPYLTALSYFDTYASSAACDTACKSEVQGTEALAAYQYGLQLFNGGQFAESVKQLEAVQAQKPASAYAPQAHAAAATAYLALGKQQISGQFCQSAISTYQTLTKRYADTPEGKQAQTALQAPVNVTGHLDKSPQNPALTIALSKDANPIGYYFSNDYRATVDANGNFTFTNVILGSYSISASRNQSGGQKTIYWSSNGNLYFVKVQPLCAMQLGTLHYPG
jgi:hypothetical protein